MVKKGKRKSTPIHTSENGHPHEQQTTKQHVPSIPQTPCPQFAPLFTHLNLSIFYIYITVTFFSKRFLILDKESI